MFVIADTHFGHMNILMHEPGRLQKARMEGYEDFDSFLIDCLNDHIEEDDEVLHLGDVAFKDGYRLAGKLHGKVTLIKGNHDKAKHLEYYKNIGWRVVDGIAIEADFDESHIDYLKYKYGEKTLAKTACLVKEMGGKRILFSHYPIFNDYPYDEKYRSVTDLLQEIFTVCGCDLNVHGHTHSYVVGDKRCVNACLEVNDFRPVDLEGIVNG